jgi:hypothetical protein
MVQALKAHIETALINCVTLADFDTDILLERFFRLRRAVDGSSTPPSGIRLAARAQAFTGRGR